MKTEIEKKRRKFAKEIARALRGTTLAQKRVAAVELTQIRLAFLIQALPNFKWSDSGIEMIEELNVSRDLGIRLDAIGDVVRMLMFDLGIK